ncbi:MAG TPA: formylglycine-generating enzyme family protein [Opitutaceae bacterium]|nr:formylglycine-generating enzyme family protein [Opitutaceae bacterium]
MLHGRQYSARWLAVIVTVLPAVGAVRASTTNPAGRPGTETTTIAPAGMVRIPAGSYEPILRGRDDVARVPVAAFWLDVHPVTNAEYLEFVRTNPKWRRSRVSLLFADEGYLGDWAGDLELGAKSPANAPVVRVSWFAAEAYAAWVGKRLPTTAEWEHAAAAGFTTLRGESEPAYQEAALGWFAQPTPARFPDAGLGRPNLYGVRDMLTLVWEWVDDFNTALVTGESRSDTGLDRNLFCGAGAASARDLTNYPAFMRAGFRSSLRASYVVPNLGFRCARSISRPAAGKPAPSDHHPL